MIYVARNPYDLCVSYYHHSVGLDHFNGSLAEFTEFLIEDLRKFHIYRKTYLRKLPTI